MIEMKMSRLKDFIESNYELVSFNKSEAKLIYEMYLEYKKLKKKENEK